MNNPDLSLGGGKGRGEEGKEKKKKAKKNQGDLVLLEAFRAMCIPAGFWGSLSIRVTLVLPPSKSRVTYLSCTGLGL